MEDALSSRLKIMRWISAGALIKKDFLLAMIVESTCTLSALYECVSWQEALPPRSPSALSDPHCSSIVSFVEVVSRGIVVLLAETTD